MVRPWQVPSCEFPETQEFQENSEEDDIQIWKNWMGWHKSIERVAVLPSFAHTHACMSTVRLYCGGFLKLKTRRIDGAIILVHAISINYGYPNFKKPPYRVYKLYKHACMQTCQTKDLPSVVREQDLCIAAAVEGRCIWPSWVECRQSYQNTPANLREHSLE